MAATKQTYALSSRKPGTVFIPFQGLKRALLVVIILAIGYCAYKVFGGTPIERGNAALVEAFSARRLIEPRLSGDFKAAPFNPSLDDESGINKSKLYLASDLIQDAVISNNPYAHLAYGRLLLCKGNKGSDALKHLRLAAKDLARKAEPHNDLGACLMQRGKLEDAIEEFDLALEIDPAMCQALFNRALCYQRLQLAEAALSDLTRVAKIEREPSWRAEIAHRLDEMTGSIKKPRVEVETIAELSAALDAYDAEAAHNIVRSYYDWVQKHVQTLVKDHLQAAVDGDKEKAERLLSRIERLGEIAARARKDNSLAATAKYLRSLPPNGRQSELNLISDYLDAAKKLEAGKFDEVQPVFESLRNKYKERGNYLYAVKATRAIAICQLFSNEFSASTKTLEGCLKISEERGWLHDYSRALINLGLSYSRRGQDSTAIKYYEHCLKLYKDMNDSEAKPRQFMGMAYWHLGNLEQALDNLRSSTSLFLATYNSNELAYNYLNIADIYRLSDKHSLALLFAEEALRISDAALDNNRAAQACSFIALEQTQLGQFDLAQESFKRAFDYKEKLKGGAREYTEPLVYIRAGEAAVLKGDTANAIGYYSKAEALASSGEGNIASHINALRGLAEAEERAGQSEKARADLQRAIDRIESYRKGLIERDHRVEFLDASQSVFDQMIELEMEDPERAAKAFDMCEHSRGRALLDALDAILPKGGAKTDSAASNPDTVSANSVSAMPDALLGVNQVRAALPEDVTLLVYSVTNQHLYTFLVSRKVFEVKASNTPSTKLARLVGDYVSDIRARIPLPELKEKSGELYQLLVAPVAERLPKDATICIVPDKSLHFLPFQTLCDVGGNYFIESHHLTYAPSASVLIRCIQLNKDKIIDGPEQFLAVGNPKFNREQFPNLYDLKEATREALECARIYGRNSKALHDSGATEIEVRKAMMQCNVAHFAVHCLVEEQSHWKAALVLAPGSAIDDRAGIKIDNSPLRPGSDARTAKTNKQSQLPVLSADEEDSADDPNDGLLSLKEIYKLNLPHTRLVVLSACQTGIGQYYRGEGIISLIHPFISARVSTVVATLWPVESEATSNLMIIFEKERENSRSGDALRAAQLQMIDKGEFAHPYYWASFIVVGDNY